jgi:hypothetical protein
MAPWELHGSRVLDVLRENKDHSEFVEEELDESKGNQKQVVDKE